MSSNNSGFFASSLKQRFPYLPLIEEPDLLDHRARAIFQLQVLFYCHIHHKRLFALNKKAADALLLATENEITNERYFRLLGN